MDINIYSLGTLPTFEVDSETSEVYWQERLAYEITHMLKDASDAGFKLTQASTTELSDYDSAMNTFTTDILEWIDSAFNLEADELPVPSPPSVPDNPSSTKGDLTLTLIKVILEIVMYWLRKKKEVGPGEDISRVLTDAMLGEDSEGNKYSLLKLLANTPIKIFLQEGGNLEDMSFETL